MIHYRQDPWLGFCILLQPHGSVLLCAVPRALIAGLLTWLLMAYGPSSTGGGAEIMWSPTLFNFFLSLAALVLAFHTNQAYQRFWEARSHVQTMASWWADAASSFVAFDEMHGRSIGEFAWGADWRARMLHLLSLLHAVSIQYLLHNDAERTQLEVLGGMDAFEAKLLSLTDDQTYLVMHWIIQEMMQRVVLEPKGLAVPPPCYSRVQLQLSNGMLAFNSACKIEDTPFPFPYVQLVQLMDWFMTLACPVVIASWMIHMPFAIILSAVAVGAFHATFAAACAMESPFGRQSNDLPLVELHRDFVNRLKSIVDTHVAACLNNMILKVELPETQDYESVKEEPVAESPLSKIRSKLHIYGGGARYNALSPEHPPHTHLKGQAANPHRAGRGPREPRGSEGPVSRVHRLPLYPKIMRRRRRGPALPHSQSHRHVAAEEWQKEWQQEWEDADSDAAEERACGEERAASGASRPPGRRKRAGGGDAQDAQPPRGSKGSAAGSVRGSSATPSFSPRVAPEDVPSSTLDGARAGAAFFLDSDDAGRERDLFSIPYRVGGADVDARRASGAASSCAASVAGTGGPQLERQSVEMLCELGSLSRGLSRRLDGRSSTRRQGFFKTVLMKIGSKSVKGNQAASGPPPKPGDNGARGDAGRHASLRAEENFAPFHSLARCEGGAVPSRRPSEIVGSPVPRPAVPVNVPGFPPLGAEAAAGLATSSRRGSDASIRTQGFAAGDKTEVSRVKQPEKSGQDDTRKRTKLVFDPAVSPAAMMEEEAARERATPRHSSGVYSPAGTVPATEFSSLAATDDDAAGLARVEQPRLQGRLSDDRLSPTDSPVADVGASRRPTFISIEEPLPVTAVRRIGGPTHTITPAEIAAKMTKPFREKDKDSTG
ncbi:hypothetical protein BESB_044230 [Besnoitia besnoiti]|uniref:Bestrophin n=1 Tax=Besnoitia besnoiti TaxID=94643 RepID=A0A2A9MJ02_BESBE|nr:hypothetical protein BESB_044230 [Besnoitia besnoiti]PFH36231.1 hypothetical protein BESB_044230 [Besnoitia besnoiti]